MENPKIQVIIKIIENGGIEHEKTVHKTIQRRCSKILLRP